MNTKSSLLPSGSGAPLVTANMNEILNAIAGAMEAFGECTVVVMPGERKQLIRAQVRNRGFIEVAFQSAANNPSLVPGYLDMSGFRADYADFENKIKLHDQLQLFITQADDSLHIATDRVYRDALAYYGALKAEAKRIPGAVTERDRLADYFKGRGRTKTGHGKEPSGKQIERDARSLLHGAKTGRVVIENVQPRTSGGAHEVIDEIR